MPAVPRSILVGIILIQWAILFVLLNHQEHQQWKQQQQQQKSGVNNNVLPFASQQRVAMALSSSTSSTTTSSVQSTRSSSSNTQKDNNNMDNEHNIKQTTTAEATIAAASGSTNTMTSSTENNQQKQQQQQQQHEWNGVAAATFLKQPKWFQRRYTAMIHNVLQNTPPNWAVQLFVPTTTKRSKKDGLQAVVTTDESWMSANRGVSRLLNHNNRIVITPIPPEYHNLKRKELLLQPWFWESLVANRTFMFSGNGVLCGNAMHSLTTTAAAAQQHHHHHEQEREEKEDVFQNIDYMGVPWSRFGGVGGDGSTHSLRNRNAMLTCLSSQIQPKPDEREDIYFARALLEYNRQITITQSQQQQQQQQQGENSKISYKEKKKLFRLATRQETQWFGGIEALFQNFNASTKANKSWERYGPPLVLGGTFARLEFPVRDALLQICPEWKTIFPSLHDPNCFGAHPNAAKCGASICALSDPHPPGGC